MEVCSGVVKVFRRVYILPLTEGQKKFFFLAVQLELSFENILLQYGVANNEETKVGQKKRI